MNVLHWHEFKINMRMSAQVTVPEKRMILLPSLSCTFSRSNSDLILSHLQWTFSLELLVVRSCAWILSETKLSSSGPVRRIIPPTSCLSAPGRRYSWKISVLRIYVCPWDPYLLHPVYERVPPTLIYQSFSFTSAGQPVSEQCWKQLQDTEVAEDARAERETLLLAQNATLHVACLMMMMMMMHLTAIFTFLFYTTDGWLCFFPLVTDWIKAIPPTAVHVRRTLCLQTSVSLCKICAEKWPTFATDVLLRDRQDAGWEFNRLAGLKECWRHKQINKLARKDIRTRMLLLIISYSNV